MKSLKTVSALLLLSSLACGIGKDDETPLNCGEGTHEDDGECVANPDMGYDDDSGRDSGTDSGDSGADSGDSGADSGDSGDSGDAVPAPTLAAVEPSYGYAGQEVELVGEDLETTFEVTFGGRDAEILDVRDDLVRVVVPEGLADAEFVEVIIVTQGGQDPIRDGFMYFDDATGLTGAIGELEWFHYNGGYWDTMSDSGMATFQFITPDALTYADLFATGMDDCVSEPTGITVEANDFGASTMTFTGAARDITLVNEDAVFTAVLDEDQWEAGTAYDLDEFDAEFGLLTVDAIARTPAAFDVTSPVLDDTDPPTLAQAGLSFRWSGSGGDAVLVQLHLYNSAGTSVVETVTCVATDDGSFSVPTGTFTAWATGRQVLIAVGRMVVEGALLPYNNASAEVAGVYWNVGAAFTR